MTEEEQLKRGDTIFALASGRGRAGVAVVRISGTGAADSFEKIAGSALPKPRRATLSRLRDPATGEVIDQGIVLWFPAPASFTGEDVAEFHVHGGRATLEMLFRALSGLPGVRPAEAGEFSLRAFHNDRMDLTEAEGLNDLVLAETEAQRRQALEQLGGAVGARYDDWRTRLIAALAHLEAAIDFSDEELPDDLIPQAVSGAAAVTAEISGHLSDGGRGERIRTGFEIVILGAPNAGKSSLMNALAKEDVAIVSEIAGTTRDVLQVRLDIAGYAVDIADTAGLREADANKDAALDAIEAEGVRRALQRSARADLRVAVVETDASGTARLTPELAAEMLESDILVISKIDILASGIEPKISAPTAAAGPRGFHVEQHRTLPLSARSGVGIEPLLERLEAEVVSRLEGRETPAITRVRHRVALDDCRSALEAAEQAAAEGRPAELIAEDLRLAVRALGRVTGRVDVESILDVVFADFCIGK